LYEFKIRKQPDSPENDIIAKHTVGDMADPERGSHDNYSDVVV